MLVSWVSKALAIYTVAFYLFYPYYLWLFVGGSSRTPSRPFSMTKWAFRDLNEMATSRGCVLSGALGAGALGRRHFRRFFWVLVFFLRCRCRKISITATPPGFPAASGFHSPYGPCYNCRCLLLRRGVCACAAPPAWAALWTVRVAALFCLPLLLFLRLAVSFCARSLIFCARAATSDV